MSNVIINWIVFMFFKQIRIYRGERNHNKENWKIKIYQLDEFETLTPVEYEIVNESDSLITERHGLMATDSNLRSVDKYYAKIQNSIFFVCYPYPKVVAIKHISNLNISNQWSLIKELQRHDASLYLHPAHVVYKERR